MRMKTRFLLTLISFSLVAPSAFAQDEVLKADWIMPAAPTGTPSQGIVFMEPTLYPDSTSFLTSYPSNSGNDKRSEHICKTINTETCSYEKIISYKAYLPVCNNDKSTNCIENFWINLKGKKFQPNLDYYMPKSSPLHFKEDVKANLPEGKSTSIWRIKDPLLGQNDKFFAVSAKFNSSLNGENKIFGKPNISIVIDPIEITSGSYSIPEASKTGNGWTIGGCLQDGCGPDSLGFCAAVDNNICAKRINNIEGIRYGIKIRIFDPPITWVHGRLINAEFLTESSVNRTSWSIEAEPATLPVTSGWISNSDFPSKMNVNIPVPTETSWGGPYSSGTQAIYEFNRWIPHLGNKAQALQKRWSLGSIYSVQKYNGKNLEECLKSDAIAGVVMSNATVYQGEPPTWNSLDSTLDYKVAAPHFAPNGDEFLGIYQLKINSEFARCIYGFQNVPLVATVSVVGNEGTSKVATSFMTTTDNWINFNVSGFTFSAPTIKVSLSEANKEKILETKIEAEPTNAITTAVSQLKKKTSITCVKGKVTKKVTAVSPKCPTGYKKK